MPLSAPKATMYLAQFILMVENATEKGALGSISEYRDHHAQGHGHRTVEGRRH